MYWCVLIGTSLQCITPSVSLDWDTAAWVVCQSWSICEVWNKKKICSSKAKKKKRSEMHLFQDKEEWSPLCDFELFTKNMRSIWEWISFDALHQFYYFDKLDQFTSAGAASFCILVITCHPSSLISTCTHISSIRRIPEQGADLQVKITSEMLMFNLNRFVQGF